MADLKDVKSSNRTAEGGSLKSSLVWLTLSKALLKSRSIRSV